MRFSKAVRNNFAAQSSGAYYHTKTDAIRRFDCQLPNGTTLRAADCNIWYGHNGRQMVDIVRVNDDNEETDIVVGTALFTWHFLKTTGKWEIVGYLT